MIKENISGPNGYMIPGLFNLSADNKMAVIVSHGLGSSKESPTVKAVAKALADYGIGSYAFDFPAHGESMVDGSKFRIETCLNDLAAVEAHVLEILPKAEIAYFSSSFGAYINLIYLAARPHVGRKSFLRCAAVNMPRLLREDMTPEEYAQLKTQGYFVMDKGFCRPLKITRQFYDDLTAHDVFKLYTPGRCELAMIHGDNDETASLADAKRFAALFGVTLTVVKGAGHRFLLPGGMEQVISTAINFFTGE